MFLQRYWQNTNSTHLNEYNITLSNNSNIQNEQLAAGAFTRQSAIFDELYSPNKIIGYKRERVRAHVAKYLQANSSILELNAGTGEDTTYFAKQGHKVHATDISTGMLQKLEEKVSAAGLQGNVTIEQCSFTALNSLQNKGPYDMIFSNFAGLNCTGELDKVLSSFDTLLVKGGIVTLVLLPPFCLWESLQALRGQFKLAFRRTSSAEGVDANVEGISFKCWYYKPSFVVDAMKDKYTLLGHEGLCTIVPPSYFEHFADKRPVLYKRLTRWENRLCAKWPWKNIGDYYIISFMKK